MRTAKPLVSSDALPSEISIVGSFDLLAFKSAAPCVAIQIYSSEKKSQTRFGYYILGNFVIEHSIIILYTDLLESYVFDSNC